jgi:hypothetical protein
VTPADKWRQFADNWRAKTDDVDSDWWRLFCSKNIAFGDEMAQMFSVDQ